MSQPTLAQLGTAIRSLRVEHGLTIEALAEKAGLHWTSIARIEKGGQNPTWTALTRMAAGLDLDLVELVQIAAEQPSDI
jgi:transcriptional regulator with XRE-family HTH domain